MTDKTFETGMFYNRTEAEDAVDQLHALGYGSKDISVMMADGTKAKDFAEKTGTKAAEGTATGVVLGGALGAIVAGLTATGTLFAVAGTGGLAAPLVAGPLAAVLAGLGAGGAAGGLLGALVGAGIPEKRAKEYEAGLGRGGILVGVHPSVDDLEEVRDILNSSSRV